MKEKMKKRNKKLRALALASLILAGDICSGNGVTPAQAAESSDSYIVITAPLYNADAVAEKYDCIDGNSLDNSEILQEEGFIVTELTEKEAAKLEQKKEILCVEENQSVEALGKKKKVKYKKVSAKTSDAEWNIQAVHADEKNVEQVLASPMEKIKVAILDSGIDISDNLDVKERVTLIPGYEQVPELYEDTTGHGTCIAGIISSKGIDTDVEGINANVEIYSAKILDETNTAPVSRVVEGIYWAMEQDVDIISISFGTPNHSVALQQAVKDATAQGILIVAAAGNSGKENSIEYPAAYPEVMAVGSVDSSCRHSESSAMGAQLEICAPGEQIKSIGSFEGEIIVSGTSMSVPHVVGAASLLWQKDKTKSADFIRQLLNASARELGDTDVYGNGLLDVSYALEMFDTFEKEYGSKKETMLDNDRTVEEYTDVSYVEGSWVQNMNMTGDHSNIFDSQAKGAVLTADDIKLIKWGMTYADVSKKMGGMTTNPYLHGFFSYASDGPVKSNYIASYIYLTRCANIGEVSADKSGFQNLPEALNKIDACLKQIDFGKGKEKKEEEMNDGHMHKVLNGYEPTKENKRRFLWGMAMHSAQDVYAHSCYEKKNGKWKRITHKDTSKDIKRADDTSVYPRRVGAAKKLTAAMIANFQHNRPGHHTDFYSGVVYLNEKGNVKLKKFFDFAKQSTKSNITGGYKTAYEKISVN